MAVKQHKVLTRKEAAQELRVSVRTVHDWMKAGKLAGVRLGGQYRIHASEIARVLREGIQ